jgi:hypothetical protein
MITAPKHCTSSHELLTARTFGRNLVSPNVNETAEAAKGCLL